MGIGTIRRHRAIVEPPQGPVDHRTREAILEDELRQERFKNAELQQKLDAALAGQASPPLSADPPPAPPAGPLDASTAADANAAPGADGPETPASDADGAEPKAAKRSRAKLT
jgi:hypothetical protein